MTLCDCYFFRSFNLILIRFVWLGCLMSLVTCEIEIETCANNSCKEKDFDGFAQNLSPYVRLSEIYVY